MSQPVCAVITTFHPSGDVLETVSQLLAQVQGLVVVDNGSDARELEPLRKLRQALPFELIENRENLGIAEALNQAVRWAKSNGYEWITFFDQDSKTTDGYIREMLATWQAHPERDRVASLHPKYVDPNTGREPAVRRAKDGGPVVSMTSGSLMPLWIFDKIGCFASEYFIDWVDFEYCFRIRKAGYLIADSRTAVLLHVAGNPEREGSFVGLTFRPTNYSVTRRYYVSRNRIAVFRKYLTTFPRWIFLLMYDSLRETTKCFVGEKDRYRKLRAFIRGTWDGLTGTMGRCERY
jgi:rhamnosyltransferase